MSLIKTGTMKKENSHSAIEIDDGKAAVAAAAGITVTSEQVWETLKECYDPEIPVNIVDLGLVYEVNVDNEIPGEANAFIQMTLTAPGCGMGPMIAADVKRRVEQIPGVKNVLVDLVFEPMWNPQMMSEAAKLVLNMG